MRLGIGYDVHQLIEGESLFLGGVEISFHMGLRGHSDADVLLHALIDALLGALGKRDIGKLFPDSDEKYKDISSVILLEKVKTILLEEGYIVNNIDMVVMAQVPRLAPYAAKIENKISKILNINKTSINFKATTTEGLGFIGRKEGISAEVIVSIMERG